MLPSSCRLAAWLLLCATHHYSTYTRRWAVAGSTATSSSRLANVLQKLSPPAAADMLASMLTKSVSFKQQVLAAVDANTRMRLALQLVQQVRLIVVKLG